MMLKQMMTHLNEYHKSDLERVAKKYGGFQKVDEIECVGIDTQGIDLLCNQGQNIRVDFAKEVGVDEIKNAIIELCLSVSKGLQSDEIQQEIGDFIRKFHSVILASVDKYQNAIASYAPLLRYENRFFIYISEIAEHFDSIKTNPNKLEVLFLEDENEAKSPILRKRLKYKTIAEFKNKDLEFEKIFDCFEEENPKASGLKTIRKMEDFHLIELHFGKGRFVKGFGEAYDIAEDGSITFAKEAGNGNPHKMPHKQD